MVSDEQDKLLPRNEDYGRYFYELFKCLGESQRYFFVIRIFFFFGIKD